MVTNINKNVPYFLEVRVTDAKGSGVEDLVVEFEIVRVLDSSAVVSGLMESRGKGVYGTTITLSEVGQYRVLYNLEDYYVDSIETIIVEESLLDKVNVILNQLASIGVVLGTTSEPTYSASNYTYIARRDTESFERQYNTLLANGWLLIKVEGNIYHFRKNEV